MRKFAALGLLMAAACVVSIASAQAGDALVCDQGGLTGANYEAWGDHGLLSIYGAPGDHYEVFDAAGVLLSAGVLDSPMASQVVPNCGFGPDGVIVRVRVNDEILSVTDPDWEWN